MALRFPAGMLVNLGETPEARPIRASCRPRAWAPPAWCATPSPQAQNYARKTAVAKDDDKQPPPTRSWRRWAWHWSSKVPVIFAAHRADDMRHGPAAGEGVQAQAELDLATEGYLMADVLAEAKVPGGGASDDAAGRRQHGDATTASLCNAAVLADHKMPLAIGTGFEGYVPKTRVLRHEAAMAMVNGLGHDRALRGDHAGRRPASSASTSATAASRPARSPTWCSTTATRSSTRRT